MPQNQRLSETHYALVRTAVGPVVPSPDEERLLRWLAQWDGWTVETLAGLLRRIRESRLQKSDRSRREDESQGLDRETATEWARVTGNVGS